MPEAPIVIVPYDASWPEQFEVERALLERLLRGFVVAPIEHIGSTAVAGLWAKPVIDVMVPVQSLDASRDAIAVLSAAGYLYAPYRTEVMHWFCKPDRSHRTHHVHLVPHQSALWSDRVAFRVLARLPRERSDIYVARYAQPARDRGVRRGCCAGLQRWRG